MGSCPLSLRIWISWMQNLHCSQQRSLCCACRNTRVASTAYKCNRIVKPIFSSPLFLLCFRACNPKSLCFSGELQAIHWCCFRSRVFGVACLTRLSPIRTYNDLPYSSHPTDIFLLEKGANFLAPILEESNPIPGLKLLSKVQYASWFKWLKRCQQKFDWAIISLLMYVIILPLSLPWFKTASWLMSLFF